MSSFVLQILPLKFRNLFKTLALLTLITGRCIRNAELGEGGMAAVGLTWEEAMAECPDGVVPACHNAQVRRAVRHNAQVRCKTQRSGTL